MRSLQSRDLHAHTSYVLTPWAAEVISEQTAAKEAEREVKSQSDEIARFKRLIDDVRRRLARDPKCVSFFSLSLSLAREVGRSL